jgi:hypothetical protein
MTTPTRTPISITVELPAPAGQSADGIPYWEYGGERFTPTPEGIEISCGTQAGGRFGDVEPFGEVEPAVLAVLAAIHHQRSAQNAAASCDAPPTR